jgi:acetolactate synthase-1/2/3 large subunit
MALVEGLRARGVDTVFGIPGVHTIELYRGLARSGLRHVTPRHEQGAGFMADGYARATGRPGVAFVITGPGLTNILTAMAQARSESVPMLVVSSTLARLDLGRGRGALHELPDQRRLVEAVALDSQTVLDPAQLPEALARAWAAATIGRPGPAHLEVALDVLGQPAPGWAEAPALPSRSMPDPAAAEEAADRLIRAARPVILAGGGARRAGEALRRLAEAIDAPVVLTANGRGLLAGHPLAVPASPSLAPVRELLAEADAVLALGTEFGPTDYDMYQDGAAPALRNLVRVDIDAHGLARGPAALAIQAEARLGAEAILAALPPERGNRGATARAARAAAAARADLAPAHDRCLAVLETIRAALPGAPIVGDSTEPVYAGNLYFQPDRPGGWSNSAMGFGTLGYALPAAIGQALADPSHPVLALVGDGGLQFSSAELATAADEGARVIALVWNNRGYREIEAAMIAAGAEPVGVRPTPPDLPALAAAHGVPGRRLGALSELAQALREAAGRDGPSLVELPAELVHPA